MSEETIQLSKKAEEQIRGAYLEIAASAQWLAEGVRLFNARGRRYDLDHEHWDKLVEQFTAIEHARHRYMEGEYQLAIDALPEF